MEVVVELKFGNGSGCIEWNFDKGSMYNGSVQWMTLPSHRTYDLFLLYSRTVHCMQATSHGLSILEDRVQVSVPSHIRCPQYTHLIGWRLHDQH